MELCAVIPLFWLFWILNKGVSALEKKEKIKKEERKRAKNNKEKG